MLNPISRQNINTTRKNPGVAGVKASSAGKTGQKEAVKASPENREDTVTVNLHLQDPLVEKPQPVEISRGKLNEVLNSERFIISDGERVGFTEEEKLALLDGKSSTFDSRLNVCIHATNVVDFYEKQLGWKLKWPQEYFTHYLGEGDRARKKLSSGKLETRKRERLLEFIKDMNREINPRDGSRVFLNIAPTENSGGPSFNVGKLQATFSPYPAKINHIKKMRPDKDPEAIGHEIGHLVNASIRPGWDEAKYSFDSDFETCALRESFADSTAMIATLMHSHNCEEVLKETGGDLSKSNRASRISEESGGDSMQGYFGSKGVQPNKRYLRDLTNNFKYVERKEAPELGFGSPNAGQLFNNVYSYSGIFSGAVYDIMTGIFEKSGGGEADSLQLSAEKTGKLLAKSVEIAPWFKPDFKRMAKSMLIADQQENNSENLDVLQKVFMDRKILTEADVNDALSEKDNLPDVNLKDIPQDPAKAGELFASKGMVSKGNDATYSLEKIWSNDKGETFMAYSMEKPYNGDLSEVPFSMSVAIMGDICDLTPDLKERSGLVMKFDSTGKLMLSHQEEFHKVDMAQNYLKIQDD